MKNLKYFKITELKKIYNDDLNNIIQLINQENPKSLLASLNKNFVREYLRNVTSSESIFLYVLKFRKKIIGYSILTKKTKNLISVISNYKAKLLFFNLLNFQFITLINLSLIFFKLDTLFLKKKAKKIINQNYNLNLLAINKQFQSKGLGTFFLKKILKKVKSKYVTVETIDAKATKFYEIKLKFQFLGSKIRIFKNQKILYKKIT